jgi:hypothetical protein
VNVYRCRPMCIMFMVRARVSCGCVCHGVYAPCAHWPLGHTSTVTPPSPLCRPLRRCGPSSGAWGKAQRRSQPVNTDRGSLCSQVQRRSLPNEASRAPRRRPPPRVLPIAPRGLRCCGRPRTVERRSPWHREDGRGTPYTSAGQAHAPLALGDVTPRMCADRREQPC